MIQDRTKEKPSQIKKIPEGKVVVYEGGLPIAENTEAKATEKGKGTRSRCR